MQAPCSESNLWPKPANHCACYSHQYPRGSQSNVLYAFLHFLVKICLGVFPNSLVTQYWYFFKRNPKVLLQAPSRESSLWPKLANHRACYFHQYQRSSQSNVLSAFSSANMFGEFVKPTGNWVLVLFWEEPQSAHANSLLRIKPVTQAARQAC